MRPNHPGGAALGVPRPCYPTEGARAIALSGSGAAPAAIGPLAEEIYAGAWKRILLLGEWLQEQGFWQEGEHCLDPSIRHDRLMADSLCHLHNLGHSSGRSGKRWGAVAAKRAEIALIVRWPVSPTATAWLLRCVGPERPGDLGLRASVERTNVASLRATVSSMSCGIAAKHAFSEAQTRR
jgi:hypothetical protein